MDISSIATTISVVSVSIAVLKNSWDGKKNNKNSNCNPNEFVRQPECHSTMDNLDKNIARRFDDLKDFIKNGKK